MGLINYQRGRVSRVADTEIVLWSYILIRLPGSIPGVVWVGRIKKIGGWYLQKIEVIRNFERSLIIIIFIFPDVVLFNNIEDVDVSKSRRQSSDSHTAIVASIPQYPDITERDEKENQELEEKSEGAKKGKNGGKFIYLFKILQFLITLTIKVKFPYI